MLVITKNAIIKNPYIYTTNNTLSIKLKLNFIDDNEETKKINFNCFWLYDKKINTWSGIDNTSFFIFKILKIAGCKYWHQLKNKVIRVQLTKIGERHHVDAIGHIINNEWFKPIEYSD